MKSYNFTSVTYLWSHGVDKKGQCGSSPRTPPQPQAPQRDPNVFPHDPIRGRDPWVENRAALVDDQHRATAFVWREMHPSAVQCSAVQTALREPEARAELCHCQPAHRACVSVHECA